MRKKWVFLLLILAFGLVAALLLPWLPGAIRRPQLYGPEGWLARRYGPSQGGADDIRAILILEDGFLAATGAGVARYAISDGRPALKTSHTVEDGLPSDNCYLLKMDSAGGVWAVCEGGVAYLPKGESRWQPFTDENGLPANTVNDLALSGRGDRVWVSTSGGLATATVESRQWKSYAKKDLLGAFAHPVEDVVWVRRVVPSGCSCGCQILTSEFDLKTETWSDIPDSQKCPHVAPEPTYFCRKNRLLWLSGQLGPPLVYNPSTRKTQTWPSEPNWERITKDRVVTYSEWFGEIAPARDDSGRMWFATTGGLWRHDPDAGKWEQHAWTPDPGCGQAFLAMPDLGNTIYWACEGNVALLDPSEGKWTHLWHVEDDVTYGRDSQSFVLSPDETHLWWVGIGGVFVGSPDTKKAVVLSDKDLPGLSEARFVRFDPKNKIALIATPRGIVCAEYSGKLKTSLRSSTCPISRPVRRIVFAPDGSEVWCLMGEPSYHRGPDRGRAAVFQPKAGTWSEIPDPRTPRCLHDVAFTAAGKTTWISLTGDDNEKPGLSKRCEGKPEWVSMGPPMPKYYGTIMKFWQTPQRDELWMYSDGCGLLRLKLASGELSQYTKSTYRRHEIKAQFALAGDYVRSLSFSKDGRRAICEAGGGGEDGATVIDLTTGKATNYASRSAAPHIAAALEEETWSLRNPTVKDGLIASVTTEGEVYTFDVDRRELRRSGGPNPTPMSAMAVGPRGYVWAAVSGRLICIDPSSGRERVFRRGP